MPLTHLRATIFVRNLRSNDTKEDVRSVFSNSGKVLDVRMRGADQALVDMEDYDAARNAVRRTNGLYGTEAEVGGWLVSIFSVNQPPLPPLENDTSQPLEEDLHLDQLLYYVRNNLPVPPQDVPESHGVIDFDKAAELKSAQKKANPDIQENELPPLEWSTNLQVLESGVGRRAGKEILGLGKAGVSELSSSTPRSRVHEMEERLHCAEERAEKAEAVAEKLLGEMDAMKLQFAALMTHLGLPAQGPGLQTNCPPQVPTQQQPDDTVLDGGS